MSANIHAAHGPDIIRPARADTVAVQGDNRSIILSAFNLNAGHLRPYHHISEDTALTPTATASFGQVSLHGHSVPLA